MSLREFIFVGCVGRGGIGLFIKRTVKIFLLILLVERCVLADSVCAFLLGVLSIDIVFII